MLCMMFEFKLTQVFVVVLQAVESIVGLERGENSDLGVTKPDDLHVVTAGSKGKKMCSLPKMSLRYLIKNNKYILYRIQSSKKY